MGSPSLSVIIPFKDERKRLVSTLETLAEFIRAHTLRWEVVFVDDGSTDRGGDLIAPFVSAFGWKVLRHRVNRGKGAAVRTGIKAATAPTVLFMDADLSTPLVEWEKVVRPIEAGACDVAIGSRALAQSHVTTSQPWWRVFIGKTGNLFIRLVLGLPYTDTQCGFKAFSAEAARFLFREQRFPRWSFDVEVLYRARVAGLRVREVPVAWHDMPGSHVRAGRDLLPFVADVIRMRFLPTQRR